MTQTHSKADTDLVVINIFTPKPGQLDSFIAVQTSRLPVLGAGIKGLRGSRFYRARDASHAVLVSRFASEEDFRNFTGSEAFAAHRAQLLPLLDTSAAAQYELLYRAGEI